VFAVDAHFDVAPQVAFDVLSQPRRYAFWVTGANEVEDADAEWPQTGTEFRHKQGIWPLLLRDTTQVIAADPPHRLELEARVRPLLVARVVLTLRAEGAGTRVEMEEVPTGGLLRPVLQRPPFPAVIRTRNRESLRRLKAIAEESGPAQPAPAPAAT
jgi:Polyketide cyclase / dehydrase and lipid transport